MRDECKILCPVPVYKGLSSQEALRLHFGSEGVPPGYRIILVYNSAPPEGICHNWGRLPRESAEFLDAWTRLEGGSASGP